MIRLTFRHAASLGASSQVYWAVPQVGAGKSSLLEALLGEIMPIQAAATWPAENSPVLRGQVAYCSQVPWIVSGSLRVGPCHLRAI